MRLDLRNVIHIPDAKAPFQLQVDLSDLEFYVGNLSSGLFRPRAA